MHFSTRLIKALVKNKQHLRFPLPRRRCSHLSSVRDEVYGDILASDEHHTANHLIDRYTHVSSMAHQVFVIQPFLRFGVASKKDTNQQLMLEESIALVNTLGWKVVDHTCVGLNSFIKPFLFGSGKLVDIESIISTNEKITAVFISMYQLTTTQRLELEKRFMVPVIDRYCLVLQIFYQHAQTQESRLQVALAEIPYLKNRLMDKL